MAPFNPIRITKQNIPYPSLDTPVVLVDLDKLEANIKEIQQAAYHHQSFVAARLMMVSCRRWLTKFRGLGDVHLLYKPISLKKLM